MDYIMYMMLGKFQIGITKTYANANSQLASCPKEAYLRWYLTIITMI